MSYLVIPKVDFSDWLSDELAARDWSQADLARASGVSRAAISKTLNRTSFPSPELCSAIAKGLNIPVSEVLQKAGILPPTLETDKDTEEMMHLFTQMTTEDQETLIGMARFFVERRANKKPAGARPAEG